METWKKLWTAFHKLQEKDRQDGVEEVIKQLVRESLQEKNRDVSATDLSMLSGFLCPVLSSLSSGGVTTTHQLWGAGFEGVKLARNLVAGVSYNQLHILNDSVLITAVVNLCNHLSTFTAFDTSTADLLKVALQLLGNLCVCSSEGQDMIWKYCYPKLFEGLLSCDCPPAVNVTCMIILTCVRESSSRRLECMCLLRQLLRCLGDDERLEWIDLLLQLLLSRTPLQLLWKQCSDWPNEVLTLLNYILEQLLEATHDNYEVPNKSTDKSTGDINTQTENLTISKCSATPTAECEVYVAMATNDNLDCLQRMFCEHAQYVISRGDELITMATAITMASDCLEDSEVLIQVQLVRCLLSVLNALCGCGHVLQQLQSLRPPITTTLDLLKTLSTMDGSADSARHRSRLAAKTTPTSSVRLHLLFAFKRDLIRLIANLSHKSPIVQDIVNEVGAFPLILNQCSIDHRNPYITQWSVLAIRNLCENNPTNQMLVAGLESRGSPNTAGLLQEMGCEVEIGIDGKMKVKGQAKK
ncbi:ataxin-10-like isoform X2 [Halichondria panicea]|uniref:ataxin-10-like isoform X2 n=1 Tax=Halichondria panicea TaxID=6063 RepID=UPI00312B2C40